MGIQKVIFPILMLGFVCAGRYIFALLQQPIGAEHLYIEHDHSLTHEAHSEIKSFIQRAADSLASSDIMPALKKEFPFIQECRVRIIAPHVCCISYTTEKPVILLGSTHCITNGGCMVPADKYRTEQRTALAQIKTSLDPDLITDTQPILSFMNHSYSCLNPNYTIEYKGEHEFILKNQVTADISLLACSDTLLTHQLLEAVHTVYMQKNDFARSPKNKNAQWVADVRFDHQIILYELKKGGAAHG